MYVDIVTVLCSAAFNGQVDCGSGLVNMGFQGDTCRTKVVITQRKIIKISDTQTKLIHKYSLKV